ncbi:hypothetical protein [Streptomyces sp. AD55]|uniref:hypothetical protein n=1 Tax=Streptomyces sp. AD55 TaxID=3242895 RepID=UPI0035280068
MRPPKDLGLERGRLDSRNLASPSVPVVDNPQEKATATVALGEDFPGAGIRLDAPAAKAPEGLRKSAADKVVCAK